MGDSILSGLLGMRVLQSSAMPGDMVVLVRNGEMMQRFIWTANALADQEREIESLRSALSSAREEARAAEQRIAAVESACGMPLEFIPTTLDAHRNTAQADHEDAEAAREEARRAQSEAETLRANLRDAQADNAANAEEARRLTEERDAARAEWRKKDETWGEIVAAAEQRAQEAEADRDAWKRSNDDWLRKAEWLAQSKASVERALAASESSERRLRGAMEALVARLDAVHVDPSYQGVWTIAHMHIGPYSGPTYVDALAAARAALGSSPGEK